MLLDHGANVDAKENDGITPLMQSVAKNKYEFTQHLLEKREDYLFSDIDIDARDKDGWSPVLYSIAGGHLAVFNLLMENGAQCLPAADGRTILMQAAAKGDIKLIRHIVEKSKEYRVYPNQRDLDGWNCLFYTIQGKCRFNSPKLYYYFSF